MECIACTQCIDACNHIMEWIGKPRDLICFSSQARMDGEAERLLRPRVILYPAVILVFLSAFAFTLANKKTADVTLLRAAGRVFYEVEPGRIVDRLRVKIRNRGAEDARYQIQVMDGQSAELTMGENPLPVPAGETREQPVTITLPATAFQDGKFDLQLRIRDGRGFNSAYSYRLLGPRRAVVAAPTPPTAEATDE